MTSDGEAFFGAAAAREEEDALRREEEAAAAAACELLLRWCSSTELLPPPPRRPLLDAYAGDELEEATENCGETMAPALLAISLCGAAPRRAQAEQRWEVRAKEVRLGGAGGDGCARGW